jgi:hypothetical protein
LSAGFGARNHLVRRSGQSRVCKWVGDERFLFFYAGFESKFAFGYSHAVTILHSSFLLLELCTGIPTQAANAMAMIVPMPETKRSFSPKKPQAPTAQSDSTQTVKQNSSLVFPSPKTKNRMSIVYRNLCAR